MKFEILGEVRAVETIASGKEVRDRRRLIRLYGRAKWRKVKAQATIRLADGTIMEAEIHWKRMASARKKSSSKGRSTKSSRPKEFVVCVRNDEYPASLELRKLYVVIDDAFGNEHGFLRVIDESGEDYLFPAEYFVRVPLPRSVEQAIRKIA